MRCSFTEVDGDLDGFARTQHGVSRRQVGFYAHWHPGTTNPRPRRWGFEHNVPSRPQDIWTSNTRKLSPFNPIIHKIL